MSLPTSFHTMIIRMLKGGLIKIIGVSLAIKAKKKKKKPISWLEVLRRTLSDRMGGSYSLRNHKL